MSVGEKRKHDVTAPAFSLTGGVSDVVKKINGPNFTVATEWMNAFLAQRKELSISEVELFIASYIYAKRNAAEVQQFFQEDCGLAEIPRIPKVNQLVGSDYLSSHCSRFLKQYHAQVLHCRPSFKEAFFRLFAAYFDNQQEARGFKSLYDEFSYPLATPEIPNRVNTITHNTTVMRDHLQNSDYVIITGTGVSSAIASRSDADSFQCASSWEGLVTVLKRKIEHFVGDPIVGYFANWYTDAQFAGLPMVQKGSVLYKMVKVYNLYHNTNIDYTRFVYDAFARVQANEHHPLPGAIFSRNVPIATTNYDMLLENCCVPKRFEFNLTRECDEASILADMSFKSDPVSKAVARVGAKAKVKAGVKAMFTKPNHRHHIYHLHGVWYSDTKLTLGVEYAALDDHFKTALDILTEEDTRPIVFLGTKSGVFDPHFKPWLSRSTQRHYIVVKDSELDNMVQAISLVKLEDRLVPVVYGDQYDHLAGFINTVLPQKPV